MIAQLSTGRNARFLDDDWILNQEFPIMKYIMKEFRRGSDEQPIPIRVDSLSENKILADEPTPITFGFSEKYHGLRTIYRKEENGVVVSVAYDIGTGSRRYILDGNGNLKPTTSGGTALEDKVEKEILQDARHCFQKEARKARAEEAPPQSTIRWEQKGCPRCGAIIPDGSSKCPNCDHILGQELDEDN